MIILLYIKFPTASLNAKASKKNLSLQRNSLFLRHFKSNRNQIEMYPVTSVVQKNTIPAYGRGHWYFNPYDQITNKSELSLINIFLW